jgi:hypothetical protein
MYAIVDNNEITKLISYPKSIVIGDVRYPAKIFQVWSQSEKEAIGIYEVVLTTQTLKMRNGTSILINLLLLLMEM